MDKLKYVKIENDDGTLSENIPIGVDAENVDVNIAGGGSENLQTNLDSKQTEINSLKTQTQTNTTSIAANASAINIEKSRIDNLAHLEEGSTTGDAELIDGRIDSNGNTYTNIGDHIRASEDNFLEINDAISKNINEQIIFNDANKKAFTSEEVTYNAWLKSNGTIDTSTGRVGAVTDFIDVIPNEHIIIYGRGCQAARVYAFYDIDKKLVEVEPYEQTDHSGYFNLVVPEKAYYIRIADYNRSSNSTPRISISKPVLNTNFIDAKISSVIKNGSRVMTGEYVDITSTFDIKTGAYHRIDSLVYDTTNHAQGTTLNNALLVTDFDELYLSSSSQYSVRVMTIWDDNFNILINLPDSSDPSFDYQKVYSYVRYRINSLEIMKKYPTAKYIAFSSYDSSNTGQRFIIEKRNDSSSLKDIYEDVENLKEYQEESKPTKGQIKIASDIFIDDDHPGYMSKTSGNITPYDTGDTYLTDMISIDKYPKYWISGKAQYQTCMMALFNENGEKLMTGMYNDNNDAYVAVQEEVDIATLLEDYPTAKYIRFASYLNPLYIYVWKPYTLDEVLTLVQNSNALYGKTAIFDGDSICQGDSYEGYSKYSWAGRIGTKNNMTWKNYGVGGGTVVTDTYSYTAVSDYSSLDWNTKTYYKRVSGVSSTTEMYQVVTQSQYVEGMTLYTRGAARHWESTNLTTMYNEYPNADYVILESCLNDGFINVPLGEISSGYTGTYVTTNYSSAFEYMLSEAIKLWPTAKIGVIIPYRVKNNNIPNYHEKARQACTKWGIPYIDLEKESNINPYIDEQRTLLFNDNATHVNADGYDYINAKIENWMKSL